jgi:HAT1-interacting factor 1
MEELASPNDDTTTATTSAPELAARELDQALNAPSSALVSITGPNAPVNDLTGMVKKKKKVADNPAIANGNSKRKAEDDGDSAAEKKQKLEDEA